MTIYLPDSLRRAMDKAEHVNWSGVAQAAFAEHLPQQQQRWRFAMATKIYLVEDHGNAPGRIYAIFRKKEDAEEFVNGGVPLDAQAQIEERTLWPAQPPRWGYNE